MFKAIGYFLGSSLVAFTSCTTTQPDNSVPPITTPVSTTPVTSTTTVSPVETTDPYTPDSIATYRPVFGAAGTVRQFPLGPANKPDATIRLTQLTFNGKLWRAYQYDDQKRLLERTDYYTDGTHIYQQSVYQYDVNGVTSIAVKLNKEITSAEGYPHTNELLPGTTITYSPLVDTLSRLERTTQTVFAQYTSQLGTTKSRLGFSPTGTLIWEEIQTSQGKIEQYTLYRRNDAGNVTLRRHGAVANQWVNQYFTYDNKPNPYQTTGDSQTIGMDDLTVANATNSNNVLTQQAVNAQGGRDTWRYAYEYRADGYPSRMKMYRNESLMGTIEYIYSQ